MAWLLIHGERLANHDHDQARAGAGEKINFTDTSPLITENTTRDQRRRPIEPSIDYAESCPRRGARAWQSGCLDGLASMHSNEQVHAVIKHSVLKPTKRREILCDPTFTRCP